MDNEDNRKIITLPYIQNFQELCRIFKKSKSLIIFTIDNTLQKSFSIVKIQNRNHLTQFNVWNDQPNLSIDFLNSVFGMFFTTCVTAA